MIEPPAGSHAGGSIGISPGWISPNVPTVRDIAPDRPFAAMTMATRVRLVRRRLGISGRPPGVPEWFLPHGDDHGFGRRARRC